MALIYKYRDILDILDSMFIWQNNNSRFIPNASDLPRHGFLDRFTESGMDLKSNQKVTGYPYNFHATIAPMGISRPSECYCGLQAS